MAVSGDVPWVPLAHPDPRDGPVSPPARLFAPLQWCRGAAINRGMPRGFFFPIDPISILACSYF